MFIFGDGFDLYASTADLLAGYWDSGTTGNYSIISPGRFTVSQGIRCSGGPAFAKSSGNSHSVHHLIVAFRQTATLSGNTMGVYLQLLDGTTPQCTIVFRSDGAIVLASGGPTGTPLATYLNATTVQNAWFAYEFEVVFNDNTGSFTIRKNGNPSNDFSQPNLLTRGGTANNFANKLQVGCNSQVPWQDFDDLLWRSDVSSVPWLGDVGCSTRMPTSDLSVQFSKSPAAALTQTWSPSVMTNNGGGPAYFTQFTAAYSGVVTGTGIAVSAVGSATSMKCAIYADNGIGGPGVVLASATTTPVLLGTTFFTFTGVSVVKGNKYWVGSLVDNGNGMNYPVDWNNGPTSCTATVAYGVFPQSNPVVNTNQAIAQRSWTYSIIQANWQNVAEPQQDGTASYVYDNTVGHADFYGITSLSSTPASVVAVTVRGFLEKSDAGTRTGTVQLKSGAITVAAPALMLATNFLWAWRTDVTDPNTGAAWTPSAANAVWIGPTVVS